MHTDAYITLINAGLYIYRTYKTIIHTYNIGYIDHIETEEEKGFHGIS